MEELAVLSKVQTCFLATSNDIKASLSDRLLPLARTRFTSFSGHWEWENVLLLLARLGNGSYFINSAGQPPTIVALHHITSGLHVRQGMFLRQLVAI
jgi:hypothetical protein